MRAKEIASDKAISPPICVQRTVSSRRWHLWRERERANVRMLCRMLRRCKLSDGKDDASYFACWMSQSKSNAHGMQHDAKRNGIDTNMNHKASVVAGNGGRTAIPRWLSATLGSGYFSPAFGEVAPLFRMLTSHWFCQLVVQKRRAAREIQVSPASAW